MSFFDSTSTAGTAFMIVGLIQIIGGIITIILGAISDTGLTSSLIVVGIGSIIVGAIIFVYGSKVRNGTISAKIDVLAGFVRMVGITTIVSGIFSAIALMAAGLDVVAGIGSILVTIIIGLIILFIAGKVNDGKQTTGDKIIWIILLLAFIIMFVVYLLGVIGSLMILDIPDLITSICEVIIYIFMLILLFDGEVKKEMGM